MGGGTFQAGCKFFGSAGWRGKKIPGVGTAAAAAGPSLHPSLFVGKRWLMLWAGGGYWEIPALIPLGKVWLDPGECPSPRGWGVSGPVGACGRELV